LRLLTMNKKWIKQNEAIFQNDLKLVQ